MKKKISNSQPENSQVKVFFREQQLKIYKNTDRIFAILMPIQWLAGILIAWFVSPLTWQGPKSDIHSYIWTAVVVGGVITVLPVFLALKFPGKAVTRYTISVSQLLISGLLIHLTSGRIETHFHVFGSLAILSFYRDWRVLIPATAVTALDHVFRGWFYPQSVYGIIGDAEWRWLEHAAWVIFEDIFLIASCRFSTREMWKSAAHTTALANSEARYRGVVEQTTEGIFLLSPDMLNIIDCNESFLRLTGYQSFDEVKKLCIHDFDIVAAQEFEMITALSESFGRSIQAERKFRKKDGSLIYVEVLGRAINYAESIAYCLNIRDITTRKKIDMGTQRLARVAQETQNVVIITDPEGKIQWVNGGFTRITGYRSDEVIGQEPGKLLTGRDTDSRTIRALQKAMKNRDIFERDIYCYNKNGQGYWISIAVAPIQDEDNLDQGFIFVGVDMTERKRMEEELRQARDQMETRVQERTFELVQANQTMRREVDDRKRAESQLSNAQQFLRDVIDNVPNMIFVKDQGGRYRLANRSLAELYGVEIDFLIGKTDAELVTNPADAEKFFNEDEHVLKMDRKVIFEHEFTDHKGNIRWMEVVKSPMTAYSGEKNVLGIAVDLTDRKLLENHLRHSQKLESIGQLAAGIAHEINTPTQYVGDNTRFIQDAFTDMNRVLEKYAELFECAKKSDVSPELLSEVEQELKKADIEYLVEELPAAIQQSLEGVSRIAKIVQSMKDFAHPGTKEKTAADLNKAIESTVTVARNEWKYVADLETNFDPTLPPVPCLLGEFNQVILNMVTNASHAITNVVGDGSQQKGKIIITTTRADDDWAEIRIADTGMGIAPEMQKRIFDPFFTTKEVGKGTGQGLAISHTVIVDQHNGKLDVESEIGKGTTFVIRLPLKPDTNVGVTK